MLQFQFHCVNSVDPVDISCNKTSQRDINAKLIM